MHDDALLARAAGYASSRDQVIKGVTSLAASVERYSRHPLAAPILAAAGSERLKMLKALVGSPAR